MSARHALDEDKIDLRHPARAFLALASVALGVPVAVIWNGHGDVPLDDAGTGPAPVAVPDSTLAN